MTLATQQHNVTSRADRSRTRLRFALVTTFYPPYHFGGDAQLVRSLAHALARRGHEVDVIHSGDIWGWVKGKQLEPLAEPEGIRVHVMQGRLPLLSNLATQQLGFPLVHGRQIEQILSRDIDVVHFHNVSLIGGPGLFKYGSGVKLYTAHEHWLVCPSHILWRHNREPCDQRQCLRCVLRHRRPPQLWRATNAIERQGRHIDAFLTPSQFCADKHREFGFPFDIKVLPNFLDINPPAEKRPPDLEHGSRPYFLFAGRLEPIKGLQDVIPRFVADPRYELWIAGSGYYESHLRQLAQGADNVRFLGRKDAEELTWLYRRARGVILSSLCFEVFPMVVLEAYRVKTPIIVRNRGPYPEIVRQSGGGTIFDSPQDLSDRVAELGDDPQLADELGQAGYRAFEERWTEEVIMDRYFGLIESVQQARA